MKTLKFEIQIISPVEHVYNCMLGLVNKSTYEKWTSAFNPTSSFEGSWQSGERIYFVGTGPDGKKGGMVSEIVENIPHTFVSIKHIGILNGDEEVLDGPEVEKWTGGLENYTFQNQNGNTQVTVEVDTTEDFENYMEEKYPQALILLKQLCETIG